MPPTASSDVANGIGHRSTTDERNLLGGTPMVRLKALSRLKDEERLAPCPLPLPARPPDARREFENKFSRVKIVVYPFLASRSKAA